MAEQPGAEQIKQFRDFLQTYNRISENCFVDCVHDFTSRKILETEDTCASHCLAKYMKVTQRIGQRFQEYQLTQNEAMIAAQGKGVLPGR
ncbi:mitochondrial import inner membrane translocase subunit Tim9-like [Branchiostoma lanceolatum]|uniref:Mitochondrial import inner membrane translocase subunit n=1 Tax=Branchiostoma lanceolatum TaxID=7740 RepID=A0A8J9ZUS0_BRALA|nr:TIMM9 [Branchiostoma lanceolatum]